MPHADLYHPYSNIHLLLAQFIMDISGRCISLKPDESAAPFRYDRWLRPRPNTQWQNLENQTLIDQSRFNSGSVYEDDTTSEIEDEQMKSYHETSDSEGSDSGSEEHNIIECFLRVMEDQDLRRNSIARLRQLFKSASLERLEEGTRDLEGSRILLEDRNYSHKQFRPYPRTLTPKQLHSALEKQVRRNPYHPLS